MGLCPSKNRGGSFKLEKNPMIFLQKLKLLQKEIKLILKQREEEREAYERETMMFAFKEADWRKQRKQLKDEVKLLRRKLEARETDEETEANTGSISSLFMAEQMRDERVRRDDAVEKWKMLYHAIKHELDDLIQKTNQGALYWRREEEDEEEKEEDVREELQRELKEKDEIIQVLKAQIASMEEEDLKRRREMDILKQSFRIICSKKRTTNSNTPMFA